MYAEVANTGGEVEGFYRARIAPLLAILQTLTGCGATIGITGVKIGEG